VAKVPFSSKPKISEEISVIVRAEKEAAAEVELKDVK